MDARAAVVRALTCGGAMRKCFLLFVATLSAGALHAQSSTGDGRVEICNADEWTFDKGAGGAQHLRGHVCFKHANATMHCDSALLYEDQRVDAFGHVTIDQGDSIHADADRLNYNGQERLARLEGNVRLRDKDMELTTPSLTYALTERRAVYTSGGHITSKKDGNTLTSQAGSYFAASQRFIFSRNVLLEHPDHRVESDTMHYVTSSGVCEFFGPTTITQVSSSRPGVSNTVIHTLKGEYNTHTERARFTRRSSVLSKGQLLEGDSVHYDRESGLGEAWGNVAVSDSSGDVRATGDVGRYYERTEHSMITGRAQLIMRMEEDTLFLHGDTLFTSPENGRRTITARRNVRFFKSDMQGACDTLLFSDADSIIHMCERPVLWSNADQITGDRISITLRNGTAHELHVDQNAMLMSRADSVHFDQVCGTTMVGRFRDNELHRLDVEGNARTVYFAREKKEGEERIIGVNRADCSRMTVTMHSGQVGSVTFKERPDAVLYPLEKAPPEELRMKGSDYRINERPVDREDIFR
ncbi:MAG TPA: OstA-like protein [Flavobacteriales bacterium]|nr:OstA-like protein [Flavobacteriales bacterium]